MGDATSKSTTKLPKFLNRPLRDLAVPNIVSNFTQGIPEFFPGQTFAPFSTETQQALGGLGSRGVTPLTQAAQGLATSTLGGLFLPTSNPFLPGLFQQAASQVVPGLLSPFAGANRFGGIAGNVLGQGLGNLATDLFGRSFEAERTRQQQALSLAPSLAGLDVADLGVLRQVGAEREAQEQRAINEAIARFQFGQNEPLNTFLGRLQQAAGFAGSTTRQTASPSTLDEISQGIGVAGQLAGLGLVGAGLFGGGGGAPALGSGGFGNPFLQQTNPFAVPLGLGF